MNASGLLSLLEQVPRPPGSIVEGARDDQLRGLEEALGASLPAQLRDWLRLCNGLVAGPGVLLGARPENEELDLAATQRRWPGWRDRGWVPVATDGSGDQYVVVAGHSDTFVYFVDCSEDPDALAYTCASSIPSFLRFLLEKERGQDRWPFDEAYVLARDPDVRRGMAALPWVS